MPKINTFELTDDVINLMKEQLENSRKSNVELGFAMCANKDNIIEAKNIAKRFEKDIIIEDRCPSGFKNVGTYHTHPDAISRPSAGDLIYACNHIADCIGGTKDNKVKCYIRKTGTAIDCIKESSELHSLELELRKRASDVEMEGESLIKEFKRLSDIKPRSRKTDIEIRNIIKNIKENDLNIEQFNKDRNSYDLKLLNVQNKYFNGIEIK